jgi:predicted acyltransferase
MAGRSRCAIASDGCCCRGVCAHRAGSICDLWLPINKKLWTSSFALFMAGIDFVLFAGFAWAVDVRAGSGRSAVRHPGMNAIAVYMVSELLEPSFG